MIRYHAGFIIHGHFDILYGEMAGNKNVTDPPDRQPGSKGRPWIPPVFIHLLDVKKMPAKGFVHK
jgi:hypothetical protein